MEDINEENAKEIFTYYVTKLESEQKNALKNEHSKALEKRKNKEKKLSKAALEKIEKDAKRSALQTALIESFSKFNKKYPVDQLWAELRADSLLTNADMTRNDDALDQVEKVVHAHNSWASVSGRGFEHIVQAAVTRALANEESQEKKDADKNNKQYKKNGIKILSPTEFRELLDNQKIAEGEEMLEILRDSSKPFDLFCVYKREDKYVCFGLIQTKTSPRERLKKEAAPSREMMDIGFFSVAVVLYGEDLKGKGYLKTINEERGWDRVYALSGIETTGNIIRIDSDMKEIAKDLITAKRKCCSNGQRAIHDPFKVDKKEDFDEK